MKQRYYTNTALFHADGNQAFIKALKYGLYIDDKGSLYPNIKTMGIGILYEI
jgi:hypothetical protein